MINKTLRLMACHDIVNDVDLDDDAFMISMVIMIMMVTAIRLCWQCRCNALLLVLVIRSNFLSVLESAQ